MTSPIRVCIGTERRTTVARKVLEHSIRRNASADLEIEIHLLEGGDWEASGPGRQYTGFSYLRWTIPERFGWSGKAIYMDADQLCLGDVGELWNADHTWPAADACVWCTRYTRREPLPVLSFLKRHRDVPETSVMLIDCARARGRLLSPAELAAAADPDLERYKEIMSLSYLSPPPVEIPQWWNLMDGWGRRMDSFGDPRAKLLHFTDVPKQPWYFPDHPKRDIWETYLQESIEQGLVSRSEIADACACYSVDVGRPDGMHPYWRKYAE